MTDGIAAVDWILKDAKIDPAAVALVGQSLGTAVATAVAEHFASVRKVEFAGLVLISPFSGLVKLLSTYSLGGVIPIFSPLAPYPQIQRFLESKVVDTWDTATRIFRFIQSSEKPRLYLVHAKDDFDIHWSHSTTLFYIAANATSQEGLSIQHVDSAKNVVDLGAQGTLFTWAAEGKKGFVKKISHHLLQYGGMYVITLGTSSLYRKVIIASQHIPPFQKSSWKYLVAAARKVAQRFETNSIYLIPTVKSLYNQGKPFFCTLFVGNRHIIDKRFAGDLINTKLM